MLGARGYRVRGLVRDPARWVDRPTGASSVRGDVTDLASVRAAAEGCAGIIHCAALVRVWLRDSTRFDRVNVDGLRHVAEAGRAAGVERILHVSSFFALGPTYGRILDESSERLTTSFHNDYERTKTLADRLARSLCEDGLPLVRLYPGVVYGPGSLTPGNHVVRLLLDHAGGRLPALLGRGDLRQCFAYVDDVAEGVALALERASPGTGYILGGDNRTPLELFQAFEAVTGIRPPRLRVPFRVAEAMGWVHRVRARLGGREPPFTDQVIRIYRHEWAYSSERARRELGYAVTPLEEGVARTVRWLEEAGAL